MYGIETFTEEKKNNTQTITTIEISEMMNIEHSKLLRKLDGGSDRKGYIEILNEAHLGVADYFENKEVAA